MSSGSADPLPSWRNHTRPPATSIMPVRSSMSSPFRVGELHPVVLPEHVDEPLRIQAIRGHAVAANHGLGRQLCVEDRLLGRLHHSVEERVHVVVGAVSYTHLRAHETRHDLVCRLLLEKKKKKNKKNKIKH